MSEVVLSDRLKSSVYERNLAKFETILNEQAVTISRLKPRLIDDVLVQCILISNVEEANEPADGVEFIETLALKLHTLKCYLVFSDETCRSVVSLYVARQRQFSPYSINFLLRCHDLQLVSRVFDLNLVSERCSGDCLNW